MPKSRNRRKAGKKRKPSTRKRKADPPVVEPPPFGSMESLLHLMGPDGASASSPESGAQNLVYSAWELADPRDRVRKAKRALEIWPDCADAWVLLAENMAESLDEMYEFYASGVEAGERALGESAFAEDVGHFWGILETRPYMRARLGLARVLKEMGQIDQAIGHLRELLRLNPGDNQGNRYLLLHWFLESDRDEEAADLLEDYADDGMAEWSYGRALLAWRRQGDGPAADKLLDAALERNGFVPAYLLGRLRVPKALPTTLRFGGKREAMLYAKDYKIFWKQTPGALDWLKSRLGIKSS